MSSFLQINEVKTCTNIENRLLKSSLTLATCACLFTSIRVFYYYYKYTKKSFPNQKVEEFPNQQHDQQHDQQLDQQSEQCKAEIKTELCKNTVIEEEKKRSIEEIKAEEIKVGENIETYSHEQQQKNKKEKENIKIREVNNSPLELRKRFNNKGFIFAHQNLATVNVELNEFIELMRRYDLNILDGCKDPNNCECTFRHKRCRLFMIRKYSNIDEMQYYSPHCSGVTTISPSNIDILMGTPVYEFIQMFQNKFSDRIMDLISYINYIVASDYNEELDYVVDVTMIADPYYNYDNKPNNIDNNKCTSFWHQDHFVETKTKQYHGYDIIALFILNAINTTPHKLMIGKLKSGVDISGMTLEQIQEHIILSSDFLIDNEIYSDIGYVIDQRKNFFHKHSEFSHQGNESKRNIITIRIKYLK